MCVTPRECSAGRLDSAPSRCFHSLSGLVETPPLFTLVNTLLIRPLPYREPGRLIRITEFIHARRSPFRA